MKISPSLMCMDLLKFKEQIEFIDSHADYFHIDIMDGHFVPNLTLSPFFVSQVKKLATKPLDCHLMVTRPQDYIAQLARAGADFITLHPETINGQAFRLIDEIRRHDMKPALPRRNPRLATAGCAIRHADAATSACRSCNSAHLLQGKTGF